jgi:hypothetical protein
VRRYLEKLHYMKNKVGLPCWSYDFMRSPAIDIQRLCAFGFVRSLIDATEWILLTRASTEFPRMIGSTDMFSGLMVTGMLGYM